MYVKKNFGLKNILKFSGFHIIWLMLWAITTVLIYEFTSWRWFTIPLLPLSVIGTVVAFYVGFKSNNSYDRLWEARKIWGAIVNSNRSWGACIRAFVGNQFTPHNISKETLKNQHKTLIYRHIAWLYILRSQLLVPAPWEHIRHGKSMGKHIKS